jgi:hypothetical protein
MNRIAHMNWRIVVAVVVAFVVGGAGGAFAEHERTLHDSSNKTATGTTRTTVANANWFGSRAKAACPALKRWNASATAAYIALVAKTPWTATRTKLVQGRSATTAAYRALLAVAIPQGKVELRFLIAYQSRLGAALRKSSSVAGYLKSQRALASARVNRDVAILSRAAGSCPKS